MYEFLKSKAVKLLFILRLYDSVSLRLKKNYLCR